MIFYEEVLKFIYTNAYLDLFGEDKPLISEKYTFDL